VDGNNSLKRRRRNADKAQQFATQFQIYDDDNYSNYKLAAFFAVSLSCWGKVMRLPVVKVAFACYSSSSRSSLIFLA